MVLQKKNAFYVGWVLGNQEIRRAYRRSRLGPIWITIGQAVQVASIGLVFGVIMKSEMKTYLPFLAVSVILWLLISSIIIEGCMCYTSNASVILQMSNDKDTFVFKTLFKNSIVFMHNIVIIPIVFLVFPPDINLNTFLVIPGLAILLANLFWVVRILGVLNARFADSGQIVASLVGVLFYITPILWMPSALGSSDAKSLILDFNPIYHLLEVVRLPLFGELPTLTNYLVCLTMLVIGLFVSVSVNQSNLKKVSLWV